MINNHGKIKLMLVTMAAVAVVASASACPFCKEKTTGLFMGEAVEMGNGTARSWVDIGEDKKPKTIGLTFNKLALAGLPTLGKDGMPPEFLMKFPAQAKGTPFNHVTIGWMAQGHEPEGIYTVPHFDFHFYFVDPKERSAITVEACKKKPAASFVPDKYMYAPGAEFQYMGAHWIDVTSPELSGKPFNSTLIYGSFNSKVHFIEPMISKAFLDSMPNYTSPIRIPKDVAKSGYYPTEYNVVYNATREEYTVSMGKFVWLTAAKIPTAKPAKLFKVTKVAKAVKPAKAPKAAKAVVKPVKK